MEYSIKVLYDRRGKASNSTKGCVEVEIYSKGKRKRYSTGVNVYKNEWKNGRVVNRADAVELNAQIEEMYQRVHEIARNPNFSLNKVNTATVGNRDFCEWLENEIRKRSDIRESTRRQHLVMARSIRECGLFKTFSDLTVANIKAWESEVRSKVSAQATVHGYHKRLKPYIHLAIINGLMSQSPYTALKVPRGKNENIKFLKEAERARLEDLDLKGTEAVVRDMFIFSCYTGLAFSDLIRVNKDAIEETEGKYYIIGERLKTGSKYKLVVLPRALEILKRYNFDMNLLTNQECNRTLKLLQYKADIKTKLTMHVGRHTFATWALTKGVRIEVVSKMLAHADIATTQIYAKVLQEEVNKGFELLDY